MNMTHIFTDVRKLYNQLLKAAHTDGWVLTHQDSDTTWEYVRLKRNNDLLWVEWVKPGIELHYSRKPVISK